MSMISNLPFSFALGVSDIEIRTEVLTLTDRFSRFLDAGYSLYSGPKGDYKNCCRIVIRRMPRAVVRS